MAVRARYFWKVSVGADKMSFVNHNLKCRLVLMTTAWTTGVAKTWSCPGGSGCAGEVSGLRPAPGLGTCSNRSMPTGGRIFTQIEIKKKILTHPPSALVIVQLWTCSVITSTGPSLSGRTDTLSSSDSSEE